MATGAFRGLGHTRLQPEPGNRAQDPGCQLAGRPGTLVLGRPAQRWAKPRRLRRSASEGFDRQLANGLLGQQVKVLRNG